MIYLDTHVILWLYAGNIELLSKKAKDYIDKHDVYISPILTLELQYLFEIKKITVKPDKILDTLTDEIDLRVSEDDFSRVVRQSLKYHWTRDPFDRMITAQAALNQHVLLTKDKIIRKHYKKAIW